MPSAAQPAFEISASGMYVPVDMQQWSDPLHFRCQVMASESARKVKMVLGGCMGDQNIGLWRNCISPHVVARLISECKRGIREWRMWSTIYM
jgi:hypothetical protein